METKNDAVNQGVKARAVSRKNKPAPAVAKPAFCGDAEGVAVNEVDGGYSVAFPFDRQLAGMMDRVPNAVFDKASKVYLAPLASAPVLGTVVAAMRLEAKEVAAAYDAVVDLAEASGFQAQQAKGVGNDVMPQLSSFREPGKFYGGEVTDVNKHFAAQFVGHGKKDGAAFMTIHRLADLNGALVKGDKVGIVYDSKFNGIVSALAKDKSAAVLAAEFQANAGVKIDGVTVSDRGDKIGIAFDINPVMVNRIRRVESAAFNKQDKVWEVSKEKQAFALIAAQDLRSEFVLDAREIASLQGVAASAVEGAKVWSAFTKDGAEHYGVVLGVSERYALQKTGRDNFALHHLSGLTDVPVVGHDTSIAYNKGIGAVADLDLRRAQNMTRDAGR